VKRGGEKKLAYADGKRLESSKARQLHTAAVDAILDQIGAALAAARLQLDCPDSVRKKVGRAGKMTDSAIRVARRREPPPWVRAVCARDSSVSECGQDGDAALVIGGAVRRLH